MQWFKQFLINIKNYWLDIPQETVLTYSLSGKPLVVFLDRTLNQGWRVINTDESTKGSVILFSIEMNPIVHFKHLVDSLEGIHDDILSKESYIKIENILLELLDSNGIKRCLSTDTQPFSFKKYQLTKHQLAELYRIKEEKGL